MKTKAPTERTVQFSLYQRLAVANILGTQTQAKLRAVIGRDVTEDEVIALYSVRRKIRTTAEDLLPYSHRFAGDVKVDMGKIMGLPEETDAARVTLDSQEARLLKTFLQGWLKTEGALADRDWAQPLLDRC